MVEVLNLSDPKLRNSLFLYSIGVVIILISVIIGLDLRTFDDQRLAFIYVLGVLSLLLIGYALRKSGLNNIGVGWWGASWRIEEI